jgi:hypothetical protein
VSLDITRRKQAKEHFRLVTGGCTECHDHD